MGVLKIKRIDDERAGEFEPVPDPEAGAVEVGQQELVSVGVEGVRVLDASHQVLELGTDEGVARICCVHVQPHLSEEENSDPSVSSLLESLVLFISKPYAWVFLANRPYLLEIVEGTAGGGAQRRGDEEGYVSLGGVGFYRLKSD